MASFITAQGAKYPEHAEAYAEFGRLHGERLWFELTEAMHAFVADPANSKDDNFVQLYTNFVCIFADHINQLRLVQICSKAVQQKCPNGTIEEYADAQRLFLDLCNAEMLVEKYNKDREAARRKKEKMREEAAKPPAQRKKELARKKKEEEAKAKATASGETTAAPEAQEEGEDAVLLVEQQKATKLGAEALFVLQMETSIILLRQNLQDQAKTLIDNGDATLQTLDCADPFVHASLHRAKAQYYKRVGPAEEFFRNALRMSAYTPTNALSAQEQVAFAKELSLSAITGDGIYNFGEVVALPVCESLAASEECAWLRKLMMAFKSGNMAEFNTVCSTYESEISQEPILHSNPTILREKMALLCLVELVFLQKPEARNVTFAQIVETTQLELDQVESLLMRAMSVGLIKGSIDQVDQVVHVSWLKPRVLDRGQIQELGKRFSTWRTTVQGASQLVQDNAADVFA